MRVVGSARDSDFFVRLNHRVITVLIDDTCLALVEGGDRLVRPPWNLIAIFVVLSTHIIEPMGDLMANDHADR